jgi:hypothetical protein
MISEEAKAIVDRIKEPIIKANPEVAREALCDLLGVLLVHVLDGLPKQERMEMFDASLEAIEASIISSMHDFEQWKKAHPNER